MGKIHQLAGVIGQRETAVIAAVVDEIVAKPAESLGLKLLPVKSYPEFLIYHEKVTSFGGVLAERVIGTEGPVSAVSSSQTIEFSPGAYQEAKRFTEKDLISLRRLGSIGERGATGLSSGALDFMGRAGEGLKQKLVNRLNKLAWDTLFSGVYTYQGITKANFAYPSGNTVTASTDWSVASSATPFTDLFNIIKTNPVYFKYIIKRLIINPVTEAAILTSSEARNVIINNAFAIGDVNKIAKILYPGLPEIHVCKDAWQDESVTAGQIVHASAQYFIPNYYVLAEPDFGGTLYGEFGEIQCVYNMNDPSATVEKPALGIYAFVDEEGLRHRKNPWVDIVTGFNGGPNVMRSNDVLVIKGKSGI